MVGKNKVSPTGTIEEKSEEKIPTSSTGVMGEESASLGSLSDIRVDDSQEEEIAPPYKVLVEKVYNKRAVTTNRPTIGLVMMVKNEKKRLKVSLDSVTGYVDCFIIFDTGSTDNTIDIIREHCEEHRINLYLIQGEFVNFSTSRNVVLDYAEKVDVTYLLLLDTNDELRGGAELKKFAMQQFHTEESAFLVSQHWWSGKYDRYFNVRFVKNRKGWRYEGSVHEWMRHSHYPKGKGPLPSVKLPETVVLYQDRTKDDDKTGKRFARDKILLYADYKKDPTDPRTLFYLAQTCGCLNQPDEALYYNKLRTRQEGFQEEKFHAYLRAGELAGILNHPWEDQMGWFMQAYEHSNRAEPIVHIANHYIEVGKWHVAYSFIRIACEMEYPTTAVLFVDDLCYKYTRWHVMGRTAFYIGRYEEGKRACEIAIAHGHQKDLDESNLRYYLEAEKKQIMGEELNRKQFIEQQVQLLRLKHPRMTNKRLKSLATQLWKKRNK